MDTAHLVEALLAGPVCSDEAGEAYPELDRLRGWVEGSAQLTPGDAREPIPLQYALCTLDLPAARGVIRHAAQALLALLDAVDGSTGSPQVAARATDTLDGCSKFRALLAAPDWLLRPVEPDTRDFDVALLLERELGGQGWPGLLGALHRAGSVEWQPAIRRCRELMRFEAETGVDLAQLMGVQVPPGEGGAAMEIKARSAAAPETRVR